MTDQTAFIGRDLEVALYLENSDGTPRTLPGGAAFRFVVMQKGKTPVIDVVPSVGSLSPARIDVAVAAASVNFADDHYIAELYRTDTGADVEGRWSIEFLPPGQYRAGNQTEFVIRTGDIVLRAGSPLGPKGDTGDITPELDAARDEAVDAAATSTAQATISTTQAGISTAQAAISTSGAATATTKAAEANVSALAALGKGYYPAAQTNLPRGIVLGAVAVTAAGSGGTNGTFALAFTGGNMAVNPTGTFTVAGNVLTAINITSPGLYVGAAITVPALSFAASAGLTGATAAALTADFLVGAGEYYWTDHATDAALLAAYRRNGSSPEISSPLVTLARSAWDTYLGTTTLGQVPSSLVAGALRVVTEEVHIHPVVIPYDCSVTEVHFAGPAQTITVVVEQRDGVTFNFTPVRSITIKTDGVATVYSVTLKLAAGEYVGLRCPLGVRFATGLGAGVTWWQHNFLVMGIQRALDFNTTGSRPEFGLRIEGTVAAAAKAARADDDALQMQVMGVAQASIGANTPWSGAIGFIPDTPFEFDGQVTKAWAHGTNAGTLTLQVLSKNSSGQYTHVASESFAVGSGSVAVFPKNIKAAKGQYLLYRHTGILHRQDGVGGSRVYYVTPTPTTNTAPDSAFSTLMQCGCEYGGAVKGAVVAAETRLAALEGASAWNALKWDALGNSITAGDPWVAAVASALGLDAVDRGVGGGRITAWAASGGETPAQIPNIRTDARLVTLQGPINDIWTGAPLGVYTDRTQGTFYGGMWQSLVEIKAQAPNALIVIMVDWNTTNHPSGLTQEAQDTNAQGLSPWQYQEAMVRVAMMAGLPCFKMYDIGMGYFTPEQYADHIHPNLGNGNGRLSHYFTQFLRQQLPLT